MRKYNRFGHGGCFTCDRCGKKTRETGLTSGIDAQVCPLCFTKDERQGMWFDRCDHEKTSKYPKDSLELFAGCETIKQVEKRYRQLLEECGGKDD